MNKDDDPTMAELTAAVTAAMDNWRAVFRSEFTGRNARRWRRTSEAQKKRLASAEHKLGVARRALQRYKDEGERQATPSAGQNLQ